MDRAWLSPGTIRPFLILCMGSMPCRVTLAEQKDLNSIIGRTIRLIDRSMILLNPIVQVLDLATLDLLTGFLLQCLDGCGIGTALVDRDLIR